jgi:hypothetical protein
MLQQRRGPKLLEDFPAILLGHHQVQGDHFGLQIRSQSQGALRGARVN